MIFLDFVHLRSRLCIYSTYSSLINHSLPLPQTYNLLFPAPSTTLITALPLLKQTFPPSTLVKNLTSSHSPSNSPILQTSVTNLSPGLTGDANLAWKDFMFEGSLFPIVFRIEWQVKFHDDRPCIMVPPKPIFFAGFGCGVEGVIVAVETI